VSVHITTLINPNSRIGREQKVAIEIAVDKFNSSVSTLFLDMRNNSNKGNYNILFYTDFQLDIGIS